jgi:hypothetical protein
MKFALLSAGGRWIRSIASAPQQALCRARDELPKRRRLPVSYVRRFVDAVDAAAFLFGGGKRERGEGFRMPVRRSYSRALRTGVRKPPRKEPAGRQVGG